MRPQVLHGSDATHIHLAHLSSYQLSPLLVIDQSQNGSGTCGQVKDKEDTAINIVSEGGFLCVCVCVLRVCRARLSSIYDLDFELPGSTSQDGALKFEFE